MGSCISKSGENRKSKQGFCDKLVILQNPISSVAIEKQLISPIPSSVSSSSLFSSSINGGCSSLVTSFSSKDDPVLSDDDLSVGSVASQVKIPFPRVYDPPFLKGSVQSTQKKHVHSSSNYSPARRRNVDKDRISPISTPKKGLRSPSPERVLCDKRSIKRSSDFSGNVNLTRRQIAHKEIVKSSPILMKRVNGNRIRYSDAMIMAKK